MTCFGYRFTVKYNALRQTIIPQKAGIHLTAKPMEIKEDWKSLFHWLRDSHEWSKILLNFMLTTLSPIWGRHGELVAKTKKDSTSLRVSLREREKILFVDDFCWSQMSFPHSIALNFSTSTLSEWISCVSWSVKLPGSTMFSMLLKGKRV